MSLVSSFSCLCTIYWSQVLSREWRCSWSSADRRCSNYIWVVNNFIAYQGAPYIRDLTVHAYRFLFVFRTSLNLVTFSHDDVNKWKPFPRYWPFVMGIHRSSVNSLTKASDTELRCFLCCAPEQTVEQTIDTPVIWDAIALIMTSL